MADKKVKLRDKNKNSLIVRKAHIEGLNEIYNDLYDTKTDVEYELKHQTADLSQIVKYDNTYASSTFSGWWGCVGTPQDFDRVTFQITTRKDKPITSIRVVLCKVPPLSEVTKNTLGVTPRPNEWEIVAEKTLRYAESLEEATTLTLSCDFETIIENADKEYLYLGILCDNLVTMGIIGINYNDIEYNPWCYYATSGSQNACQYYGVGTHDIDSKKIWSLAAAFYKTKSSVSYLKLGTTRKDKFFELR